MQVMSWYAHFAYPRDRYCHMIYLIEQRHLYKLKYVTLKMQLHHQPTRFLSVFFFLLIFLFYFWANKAWHLVWILCLAENSHEMSICKGCSLKQKKNNNMKIKFNPSLAEHDMPCLSKQCRSRSVGFWRSRLIWICTVCH